MRALVSMHVSREAVRHSHDTPHGLSPLDLLPLRSSPLQAQIMAFIAKLCEDVLELICSEARQDRVGRKALYALLTVSRRLSVSCRFLDYRIRNLSERERTENQRKDSATFRGFLQPYLSGKV
jgi:hypothetical protein